MSLLTMPPCSPFIGLGRWCFFTCHAGDEDMRFGDQRDLTPLALVATGDDDDVVAFLVLRICYSRIPLEHFGASETIFMNRSVRSSRDRPEDAGADGLELREEHGRVGVEADSAPSSRRTPWRRTRRRCRSRPF
jgi:hypothetical protein